MSKKCHSCNGEVSETHTGKCPHCGEEKGYTNTREINETVKISDFITAEKKAMKNALDDTYTRYDELDVRGRGH